MRILNKYSVYYYYFINIGINYVTLVLTVILVVIVVDDGKIKAISFLAFSMESEP